MSPQNLLKLKLEGLGGEERAQVVRRVLEALPHVKQVDVNVAKQLARLLTDAPLELPTIADAVQSYGVTVSLVGATTLASMGAVANEHQPPAGNILKLEIEGMHCRSCELLIERKFRQVAGVAKVEANAATGITRIICINSQPDLVTLQTTIAQDGYRIRGLVNSARPAETQLKRPSWWQLVGLFTVVLVAGSLLSRFGLLRPNVSLGGAPTFWAVFFIGLVAASSSCIAVAGGLMLASVGKFNERYQGATHLARMRPVLLFVGGRLLSYALLGGLIGLLGKALSPSPAVVGAITVLAALYMFIMGLEMLHLAPRWLKRLLPRMPKSLAHRVMDAEGKSHPLAPFLLGAGTFFLPCGFTQALQLYVLTTASFATGALVLFAFALGTTPALLALGWASGSLKGKAGQLFFRLAGAAVIVLGIWNFQNGLTIAGYPLSLPTFSPQASGASGPDDPNVSFNGRSQVVRMAVGYSGYSPNQFTLRQGVPTRWEVEAAQAGGCLTVLQAPQLGIRKLLQRDQVNVIEFTPQDTGSFTFSCSMGMFRGQINVVPNA